MLSSPDVLQIMTLLQITSWKDLKCIYCSQNESEGRLKLVPSLKVQLFLGDGLRLVGWFVGGVYFFFFACLLACFLSLLSGKLSGWLASHTHAMGN